MQFSVIARFLGLPNRVVVPQARCGMYHTCFPACACLWSRLPSLSEPSLTVSAHSHRDRAQTSSTGSRTPSLR